MDKLSQSHWHKVVRMVSELGTLLSRKQDQQNEGAKNKKKKKKKKKIGDNTPVTWCH